MPSVCAFVSLLPASSPATTYDVFFETEDVTLPPFFSISAVASARVSVGSVPVRTNVLPSSPVAVSAAPPDSIFSPAALRRSTSSSAERLRKKL